MIEASKFCSKWPQWLRCAFSCMCRSWLLKYFTKSRETFSRHVHPRVILYNFQIQQRIYTLSCSLGWEREWRGREGMRSTLSTMLLNFVTFVLPSSATCINISRRSIIPVYFALGRPLIHLRFYGTSPVPRRLEKLINPCKIRNKEDTWISLQMPALGFVHPPTSPFLMSEDLRCETLETSKSENRKKKSK
jgi:hypothetical protein